MALPNVFSSEVSTQLIGRIEKLSPLSTGSWGKMNVAQMLAHCNVTYEMAVDNIHKKPNFLMKLMLKTFVKKIVVSEVPYKQNSQTAPAFLITDERDFMKEKTRLIHYIQQVEKLGENHFEGKESLNFGKLNKAEWNNMFYKHLDHHLTQFGV